MFDMSKINDSLASSQHDVNSNASSRHTGPVANRTTSQPHDERVPQPVQKQPLLSVIAERETSGDRSRALEQEGHAAIDMKSRSKSVGSKTARPHNKVASQSVSRMRPSISASSLENKQMIINGHSYIWLSVLGKGGSSRVYEVFDERRSEVCALKVVDLGDDPVVRRCYLNEVKLLKSLQGSPYVIKMLDYELRQAEKTLYVLMEKGDIDLASFLKTRRTEIDSSFIKYHWNEMLRCVKVIHDRKIVHSDLKPANFLFVRGNMKLIDFGIAAGIPNDMTGAVKESQMGTLSYMAPEVLHGGGGDGKFKIPLKADVWSLGCILYNMVYGRLPFSMKGQAAKMAAIMSPEYVIDFSGCQNHVLVDVMKRCLVRDLDQRADINELLEHPYLTGRSSPVLFNPKDEKDKLDFLAIAKELQNNTPNTMARRLEELTRRSQSCQGDNREVKKVLDFS